MSFIFFFFNDPPTTEIYPLPLPDALPIPRPAPLDEPRQRHGHCRAARIRGLHERVEPAEDVRWLVRRPRDRKSTRLNSSHSQISYAVFCLKKKKKMSKHGTLYTMSQYRRL